MADVLVKVAFCFSMLTLTAFVQVPIMGYDYPLLFITCFLLTQLFRRNYALIAVMIYLVIGLSGLPVFTYGGGFTYVHEASFGYLLCLIPLALLGFFWKHIPLSMFGFRYIKNFSVVAIVVAHVCGFMYLLISGRLSFDNFMGLSFYPLLYDMVLGTLLIMVLPESESYEY